MGVFPGAPRAAASAAVVFVAVLAAGALLMDHLERLETAKRRHAAQELARGSAAAIEQRFAFSLAAAATLGAMVEAGATEAQLDAVARRKLSLAGAVLSLQLAPGGVIRHIWPEAGNEAALGLDLLRSPLHGPTLKGLAEARSPMLHGPFSLIQGGTGFALRVPVFTAAGGRERYWGLASAVFRLDDLLSESRVPRLVEAGFDYAIQREGDAAPARRVAASSPGADLSDAVSVPVELPGQRWTLSVVARGGWRDGSARALPAVVLLVALLAAVLAYRIQALPALLRREVAARTRELEEAHADQRRAEEAQRQSQKLESIGLLAGGVAHDFNNLLVGILGYADVLAAEAAPGTVEHEAAATIRQAARRGAELTRQLLALARLGHHREEQVDLHALVAEGANLLGRTLDKSIRLEARLDAPLHSVRGDPGQLQQVILNLAVNARDAMPAGGTLTLETGSAEVAAGEVPGLRAGAYVTLAVADTGVGIAPEHLGRIFDPFFTTKPVGKGSGLGLATAFGIAKGHGGTIRVESAVGAGARFVVYLPWREGAQEPPPAVDEGAPRGAGVVLVIDDEELVRRTAAAMLASLGYEPAVAAGGREALEWLAARADPPAAVLLDLAMPELDGRSCLRELRARHPGIAVVMCSGFADAARARELLAEGAAGFLPKPYRRAELARALSSAAASRAAA